MAFFAGHDHVKNEHSKFVRAMVLRLLVKGGYYRNFLLKTRYEDDDLQEALGLPDADRRDFDREQALLMLRRLHADLDASVTLNRRSALFHNIEHLGQLLNLNPVERLVLAFCVLVKIDANLRMCVGYARNCSNEKIHMLLAVALDLPVMEVRAALSGEAPLISTGFVTIERRLAEFEDRVVLSDDLVDILMTRHRGTDALVKEFFRAAAPEHLAEDDFPHAEKDLDTFRRVLETACQQKRSGINIVIYGPPGTGKTQFARLLASRLKKPLYEVQAGKQEADFKNPVAGFRLASYQLCQRILGHATNNLVLFDEFEDVIPVTSGFMDMMIGTGKRASGKQKAWMNALLETNPVPTIWIANEAEHIDLAFLRRYTYIMALKTPPRSVRERILNQYLKDQPVSPDWIRTTAHIEHLPPALIENASRVLTVYGAKNHDEAEALLDRTLGSSLQLMGYDYTRPTYACATGYDPRFINASVDSIRLRDALKRHRSVKMCFYGPPGTGKTAFAHYLAEQADRPVLVKSASDLLDKYVGETEARIARMFEQAYDENAVLILDEADSFLRDRREAAHSWEVTRVNELLVQMERFKGTFICTTNLMERLDAASLRRFSFKVHFNYLTPQQRIDLLIQEFREMLPRKQLNRAAATKALDLLDNLTPGDIAVVKRQAAFFETAPTLAEILDSLALECRSKPGQQNRQIGFLR